MHHIDRLKFESFINLLSTKEKLQFPTKINDLMNIQLIIIIMYYYSSTFLLFYSTMVLF